MLSADRETDRAGRQIEQVTAKGEVFGHEHRILNIVGVDENFVLHLSRILADAEWVEGRRRIAIEQTITQSVVVHESARPRRPVAFIVAKAHFPFPGLQLVPGIGELAQIAFEPDSEEIVIGPNFKCAQTGFQRTITNTGGELRPRRSRALLREPWEGRAESAIGGVVGSRERIERVLGRNTDTGAADSEWVRTESGASGKATEVRPDIRHERRRRQAAIPKLPEIFKVGNNGQIFVAKIAIECAVEILTIGLCD